MLHAYDADGPQLDAAGDPVTPARRDEQSTTAADRPESVGDGFGP